ncbi:MAG TPA: MBL fold metallo-hydrolase [Burkholderiales bacterium]|nr:MBL fold metallo-hydrolase [Burkholderiales bacterium]
MKNLRLVPILVLGTLLPPAVADDLTVAAHATASGLMLWSQHRGASGFDRLLDDGVTIWFAGESLHAISAPGHAPGSTCYPSRARLRSGAG